MTLRNATSSAAGSSTKAAISSGVGGRPIRSHVARRISVRRSTGGAASRSSSSSFALIRMSTGFTPSDLPDSPTVFEVCALASG